MHFETFILCFIIFILHPNDCAHIAAVDADPDLYPRHCYLALKLPGDKSRKFYYKPGYPKVAQIQNIHYKDYEEKLIKDYSRLATIEIRSLCVELQNTMQNLRYLILASSDYYFWQKVAWVG